MITVMIMAMITVMIMAMMSAMAVSLCGGAVPPRPVRSLRAVREDGVEAGRARDGMGEPLLKGFCAAFRADFVCSCPAALVRVYEPSTASRRERCEAAGAGASPGGFRSGAGFVRISCVPGRSGPCVDRRRRPDETGAGGRLLLLGRING